MSIDLGELYAASRYRITDLIMSSPADVGGWPCPATPDWTVHDVVAHLRGVAEDVRNGNVAAAGTDPWTAEQVKRHCDCDVRVLLSDWGDDAPLLESFLSSPAGKSASRAVIDVYTHEADIRGALGRPADLPHPFGEWVMVMLEEHIADVVVSNGLSPVTIVTDEGDVLGDTSAAVMVRSNRFELFRAILGRRSPEQVAAWDWAGSDPQPYLQHLFVFGPRTTDLIEDHAAHG